MISMPEHEARIAVLETKLEHLETTLDKMSGKVDEMHSVLLKARGVQWFILGVAAVISFLAGKLGFFTAFFTTGKI